MVPTVGLLSVYASIQWGFSALEIVCLRSGGVKE